MTESGNRDDGGNRKAIIPDMDWSLWNLPFFDPEHTALEADLRRWRRTFVSFEARIRTLNLEEQCRALALELGNFGLLRHAIPGSEQSGQVDVRSVCMIREALAYDSALADFVFAMQGIGSAAVWQYGTSEIKQAYLAAIREGTALAAFAMSEPDGGSDVAAISTTARAEGDEYVINGVKSWVSNGGIASHYIVIVRSEDMPGAKGLSAVLVDAESPGLSVESRVEIISPHPLATLRFTECRVPRGNLLGLPGTGFKAAMSTLDIFRISVGAAAVGLARRALDETISRVKSRQLFGIRMSEMDTVRMKLAEMKLDMDCAAMLVYRAAWLKDTTGGRATGQAAMAKVGATEAAQRIIDSSVQLFGGMGVSVGSIVERLYRDIRPMRIYEGASEVQKLIIGRKLLD